MLKVTGIISGDKHLGIAGAQVKHHTRAHITEIACNEHLHVLMSYHTFHLGLPFCHIASISILSLKASMHFQKPLYL